MLASLALPSPRRPPSPCTTVITHNTATGPSRRHQRFRRRYLALPQPDQLEERAPDQTLEAAAEQAWPFPPLPHTLRLQDLDRDRLRRQWIYSRTRVRAAESKIVQGEAVMPAARLPHHPRRLLLERDYELPPPMHRQTT